ncbi:hypothetical protein F2P81_021891 [Scophthalmus maximus]|uniref:Uncharacterized protein n=1 Tax=Scophthalmus maximus TaxID=52904 RepID=A0A6A4S057_SCOMX|nr:hypothetical protein F2P81_021891 [Scophthalmus maximus]
MDITGHYSDLLAKRTALLDVFCGTYREAPEATFDSSSSRKQRGKQRFCPPKSRRAETSSDEQRRAAPSRRGGVTRAAGSPATLGVLLLFRCVAFKCTTVPRRSSSALAPQTSAFIWRSITYSQDSPELGASFHFQPVHS